MNRLKEGDVFVLPVGTLVTKNSTAVKLKEETWYIAITVKSIMMDHQVLASELWRGEYNQNAPTITFYQVGSFSIHRGIKEEIKVIGNRKKIVTYMRY
jgi:hypothetical protein